MLASLTSSLVTISKEQIISISRMTSSASKITRPSESTDDRCAVFYHFVYLQGGIFLYFESHGQLRCCLLHRHLGFVVFLWLFVFFFPPTQNGQSAHYCHLVTWCQYCAQRFLERFQQFLAAHFYIFRKIKVID